jgi:cleavage stimulation factor subunit 3
VVNRITQKPEGIPRAKPLFAFFHEYESQFGELAQIVKLEKRMSTLFPEDPQLIRFAQRYSTTTFDPTQVRPVISLKSQMKPVMLNAPPTVVPTVEEHQAPPPQVPERRPSPVVNSPRIPTAMAPIATDSPKRPFEDVDNELSQPRKIVRGESPLKGAAGRRLDAARRNMARAAEGTNTPAGAAALPPPPLPREINFLLSVIPDRKYYAERNLNPQRIVELFRATHIPSSLPTQQHQHTPAPVVQHQPPPMGQPMNYWAPQPPQGMGGKFHFHPRLRPTD